MLRRKTTGGTRTVGVPSQKNSLVKCLESRRVRDVRTAANEGKRFSSRCGAAASALTSGRRPCALYPAPPALPAAKKRSRQDREIRSPSPFHPRLRAGLRNMQPSPADAARQPQDDSSPQAPAATYL